MRPIFRSGPTVPSPGAVGLDGPPGPSDVRDAAVALARQAGAGDALATRRLLDQIAPRVVGAARAAMGHAHVDLEDAIQLSLIGFIQALPSFRGDCHPALFAARIAVRTAGAVRRRARARQDGRDVKVEVDALQGGATDTGATRRREAVRALLDQLPDEQAEALALRFMLGWSIAEISEASGAPVNTVRSRLRLAKEAVRRRIEADAALAEEFAVEDES